MDVNPTHVFYHVGSIQRVFILMHQSPSETLDLNACTAAIGAFRSAALFEHKESAVMIIARVGAATNVYFYNYFVDPKSEFVRPNRSWVEHAISCCLNSPYPRDQLFYVANVTRVSADDAERYMVRIGMRTFRLNPVGDTHMMLRDPALAQIDEEQRTPFDRLVLVKKRVAMEIDE